MNQGERLYYLDSMRAVLMSLGVLLHSMQIYNPSASWLIYSDSASDLAAIIVDTVHIFRMPAFFVVSGYFCLFTLEKYALEKFVSVRIKRIVIPLFVTALTLNSLQEVFLNVYGWRELSVTQYLSEGAYIGHLWFLINLIIYFSIIVAIYSCFGEKFLHALRFVARLVARVPMPIVILLLPSASIVILALNHVGFPLYGEYWGVLKVFQLLSYIPFFIFGVILAANQNLLERFSCMSVLISLSMLVVAVSAQYFLGNPEKLGFVENLLYEYSKSLLAWSAVAICFFCFYAWLNKKSQAMFFLAGASYTVYLFHHLLVVLMGSLAISLEIPSYVGMLLVPVTVFMLCVIIHKYIISRVSVLSFLFNGK